MTLQTPAAAKSPVKGFQVIRVFASGATLARNRNLSAAQRRDIT
jgi:hypothetical protein